MRWTFALFHLELSSGVVTTWIEAANRKASSVPRHGWQVWQAHSGTYRSQPSSQRSRVSESWQFLDQTGLQKEEKEISSSSLQSAWGPQDPYLPAPGHLRLSSVDTLAQAFAILGAHPHVAQVRPL